MLAATSPAAGKPDDCGLREEYVRHALAADRLAPDKLLELAISSDTRVVVLAENHYKRPAGFLGDILASLKRSDRAFNWRIGDADDLIPNYIQPPPGCQGLSFSLPVRADLCCRIGPLAG